MDDETFAWAARIKQEHQQLLEDLDVIHNQVLHRRILDTWKSGSRRCGRTSVHPVGRTAKAIRNLLNDLAANAKVIQNQSNSTG